jgi:hypothetical protein
VNPANQRNSENLKRPSYTKPRPTLSGVGRREARANLSAVLLYKPQSASALSSSFPKQFQGHRGITPPLPLLPKL